METLEKIKELANKQTFTDEEKAIITAQCEELGIEFTPKARCKSCWTDAATLCYITMRKAQTGESITLREGVDVLVNGSRLNAATLTPEWLAELEKTMPRWWLVSYFEGYEN